MSLLSTIVVGLSLPIRSICCTLWYKTLYTLKGNSQESKPKKQKRSRKDESENE
jgi:hypothetical protein